MHDYLRNMGFGAMVVACGVANSGDVVERHPVVVQIQEGLNLAAGPKYMVVKTYRESGQIALSLSDAGVAARPSDIAGRYVASIDLVGGVIVVRFGKNSDDEIAGKTLTLVPYESAEGQIAWKCGYPAVRPDMGVLGALTGNPIQPLESTVPFEIAASYCAPAADARELER